MASEDLAKKVTQSVPIGQSKKVSPQVEALQKQLADLQEQFKNGAQKSWDNGGSQLANNMSMGGAFHRSNYESAKRSFEENRKSIQSQLDEQLKNDQEKADALQPFETLASQQKDRAGQFRAAFPSIVENQLSPERVNARRAIASGVNQNNASYNHRGLLYSGLRAGGAADVSAGAASDLAQKRSDIQQKTNDTANELDQQAINTGLVGAQVGAGYADANNQSRNSILDALMEQSRQTDATVGGLMGAGGALAGKIAGNLATPKAPGNALNTAGFNAVDFSKPKERAYA